MNHHQIKYNLVAGSVAERAEQVKEYLKKRERQNTKIFEDLYNYRKTKNR